MYTKPKSVPATLRLTTPRKRESSEIQGTRAPTSLLENVFCDPTLFARSFRRRFFAYYYAVNHPHTNIILS